MSKLDRQLNWITFDMALVSLASFALSLMTAGTWIPLMFENPDGWLALLSAIAGVLYFTALIAIGPLLLLDGQANRMLTFYSES